MDKKKELILRLYLLFDKEIESVKTDFGISHNDVITYMYVYFTKLNRPAFGAKTDPEFYNMKLKDSLERHIHTLLSEPFNNQDEKNLFYGIIAIYRKVKSINNKSDTFTDIMDLHLEMYHINSYDKTEET